VSVSSGTATSASDTSLTAGSYTITAVFSGGLGFAASQGTESVTVNGPAPSVSSVVVNGATFTDQNGVTDNLQGQNSVVQNLLVTFNEAVTLDSGAINIVNDYAAVTVNNGEQPSQLAVNAVVTPVAGSGGTQFEVTFSGAGVVAAPNGDVGGNVIDDGLYQLVITASKVHANSQTMAANSTTTFWKLYGSIAGNQVSNNIGDGNSEVYVTAFDENEYFNPAFGSVSSESGPPYYNPFMDSKLDGYVDALDVIALRTSYNTDWSF